MKGLSKGRYDETFAGEDASCEPSAKIVQIMHLADKHGPAADVTCFIC